jgi:hypothetical protein
MRNEKKFLKTVDIRADPTVLPVYFADDVASLLSRARFTKASAILFLFRLMCSSVIVILSGAIFLICVTRFHEIPRDSVQWYNIFRPHCPQSIDLIDCQCGVTLD